MHISLATLSDIPALCGLLNSLFSQELEFSPDVDAQSCGLGKIIADPEIGCILVARRQEQVIGMVNLLYTVSTALGARVAILEDMVMMPAERNAGLGSLLLGRAVEQAKARDCRRITLLTDQTNLAAQRFYARQGFAVSGMIPMRLDLRQ
ncbi:MAG: GNAT family N-acetyltransferase [Methylococcales bacterium]|nr:GNAT family N-acetyltransferase [Methylococcales bacterium]